MATLLDLLASYVPPLITRRFIANPAPLTTPVSDSFPAAVLFADISGFTALSEKLAQHGPVGAEELTHALNDYFGQLIAIVTAHGGEVVKFAGDALLALWPIPVEKVPTDQTQPRAGLTLPYAALLATQSALTAQRTLRDYVTADGQSLSMRMGVAAGDVFSVQVGGTYGRWEFLLTGEPLTQVSMAEHQAQPGQIVLAPSTWKLIAPRCIGEPLPTGDVRLETVKAPISALASKPLVVPPEAEAALRVYVPVAIRGRLAAGQTEWLAELRRVTTLFVNLPDLNYHVALEQAQTVMKTLQNALYHYEGSINKLNVDDKGSTLVAALGLPPFAHEDDPVRGILAALKIQNDLRQLGLKCAVGVTTGQVFCGSVGSDARREYTMIGDGVNLAARLMQAAPDDILCDAATYQAAQAQVRFDTLPAIHVKGKAEAIPVFRPVAPHSQATRATSLARASTPIVGRAAERAMLVESLTALQQRQESNLIIIEGDAGIGKSRLVEDLRRQANERRLTVFVGAGDAVEKSTPYFAWRNVFNQLYDLGVLTDPEARRKHILDLLEIEEAILPLAPLLNEVLLLGLPDTELTAQMEGQVRADNTRDLLLQALRDSVARSPKVIVIEDAHWLDSASWALAGLVSQKIKPLLFVIATRPMSEPLPMEYRQLTNVPNLKRVRLETLAPEEVITLVCQRLGVAALPTPVIELLRDKAEGHPFFSEELAYALRDAGLIQIAEGECHVAPEVDLRAASFPNTVQGVITSRIDRLTPQQQLALKTASVIGRVFAFRLLRDIHPIVEDRPHLQQYLQSLEGLDLTPLETPEPDLSYIFKHIITQEVAYNLMLFAQRRELHRAVAEWYEQTYADDLSPHYPLLAHHWGKAEISDKTLEYLEKAGEEALRDGAYREAAGFLGEALRMAGQPMGGAAGPLALTSHTPLQIAHWEVQLGIASLGLGQLSECNTHLRRALDYLHKPMPGTTAKLIPALLWQVGRQILHRFKFNQTLPRIDENDQRPSLLEAARAYERLGETYFFANETLATVFCTLRTLNLAERAGPTPELARAYANMTIAAGLAPLHPAAENYARLALTTARQIAATEGGEEASPTLASALGRTGVYGLGVGHWSVIRPAFEQAQRIYQHLGDWRRLGETLALRENLAYFTGDFQAGVQAADELLSVVAHSGDVQQLAWAYDGRGAHLTYLGQLEASITLLSEKSLPVIRANADTMEENICRAELACALARAGELSRAAHEAELSLMFFRKASITTFSSFKAYEGLADAWLRLWETEPWNSKYQASAELVCQCFWRYARIFPIGQAPAWIFQGVAHWLAGRPTKAQPAWRKGLAFAQQLHMPYQEARALWWLGKAFNQKELIEQAGEIFERLGAKWDVGEIKKSIASSQ